MRRRGTLSVKDSVPHCVEISVGLPLPHSGQSSQLVFDANDGNTQALPKLVSGESGNHTNEQSVEGCYDR